MKTRTVLADLTMLCTIAGFYMQHIAPIPLFGVFNQKVVENNISTEIPISVEVNTPEHIEIPKSEPVVKPILEQKNSSTRQKSIESEIESITKEIYEDFN